MNPLPLMDAVGAPAGLPDLTLTDALVLHHVHHREQGAEFHPCLGFLPGLAQGRLTQRLADLHEAGRHRPEAATRLDGPPAEQDRAPVAGHAADDDQRVLVVHVATAAADMAWPVVARRHLQGDGLSALAAEVHGGCR